MDHRARRRRRAARHLHLTDAGDRLPDCAGGYDRSTVRWVRPAGRDRPSTEHAISDDAIGSRQPGPTPSRADLADLVRASGLQRVHLLAWRDLADTEAGGSEVHAAMVARLWTEAGLEVTMRTSYAQGHPPEASRDGYRVIRRSGRYFVFPSTIVSEMMGWHGRRDAILEVWNGVPFLSPIWSRCPHAVVIHHVHKDMWRLVLEERLARAGELLELRIAPRFYRRTPIITVSPSSRREIIDLLGIPPQHVTIASPGVGEQFVAGGEKATEPTIVAVGRLMPPKRFDELIRIAAEVRETVPDLRLVIAGDGYMLPRLQELVRDLGAGDWVRLAGRVSDDELLSLYRRAWVVASASVAEGFGMTIVEAASCGTPAVATRITGHQDSIDDGVSGLLAGSTREMVEHLTAVLTDAALRERLTEGARKHAAAFTWEATAYGTLAPLAEAAIRRRSTVGRS